MERAKVGTFTKSVRHDVIFDVRLELSSIWYSIRTVVWTIALVLEVTRRCKVYLSRWRTIIDTGLQLGFYSNLHL